MLGWVGGENFNAWRESLQIVSAVRSPARVRTTVGVWEPTVEVYDNRILIELMPRIDRYHAVPCTTCVYRYSGTQHVEGL